MYAEILAVGSELTTGAKLDTNSQWLSLALADLGISVLFHTTVADELDWMVAALKTAAERVDVIIITGGLGPTLDDLTREAAARCVDVPLVVDEHSLAQIKAMFARRKRDMPERNVIQAQFPQGAEPIPNARGTAPGFWMEIPRNGRPPCRVAALPGVPSEMKPMFKEQVVPRLETGSNMIRRARINCFGVGESAAEQLLGDLTARGRDPEVGITVHEATITLRIVAKGTSTHECEQKISSTREIILNRMGTLVFGEEDEELEHAVIRLLGQQRKTLSTAESGTGGLLAHRLTSVPGFDSSYGGGYVVPTTAARLSMLEIDPRVMQHYGAISPQTAMALASACRRRFTSDFALAVTEWPSFKAEDASQAVPASYIALATKKDLIFEEVTHFGDPAIAKSRTAKAALNMLRLRLLGVR
ncbi:CinA family nicotinamide mononucleotide deamidase-related protein [Planctopirus hydrillae]|uniref:CinA-like protein n=1 Tax=Planctopirus hydrillae TaxID=1841610 RepID=A0A1C3E6H2_9PLAN|nr:CinA family nicotinamide mononucleotide deamidase-related protein [Planctopirus hydrillae]ODA28769.1 damage-inducible protein CinA [Planctopirus hydrillae]